MSVGGWVGELVSEWVRVFLCVCVHLYIYIYMYMCVCICIDIHMNTRMYIHSIYVYLDG